MRWLWIISGVVTLGVAALFGPEWWAEFGYWFANETNGATKAQAISAAVQAVAAVILLAVTAYYAYVTRQALDANNRQAEAAQRQFELGQKQFEFAQKQFEFAQQQAEASGKNIERQLELAHQQLLVTERQLEQARRQFTASMIPRLSMKVYPGLENSRIVHWQICNLGQHDLFIKGAEIRWSMPGQEWTYLLAQYPGGVFAPNDELSSKEYNAILIPDKYWPQNGMSQQDAIVLLTLSFTVSDVAELLTFQFEFTPGKGQKVTVIET